MQLPQVCHYQEISYTILIQNSSENAVFVRTFNHTGSGTVCHHIDHKSGLEVNKNYFLMVTVNDVTSGVPPVTAYHTFCK